ncbi:putative proline-rich receptor-like protein kinase PERK11 [Zingiber officinale]|uniref:putative proline-rich receptor-like protein kinase PERK11 n=1 Tax=Zingiber officinale TaxID=94328 RepID=UPI001C4D6704|nr:putative proline-rich receptor-like protein kinase PERK11 [Zingiber officinale]
MASGKSCMASGRPFLAYDWLRLAAGSPCLAAGRPLPGRRVAARCLAMAGRRHQRSHFINFPSTLFHNIYIKMHIFRRGGRRRRPQDQTHPSPASEPMPPPTQAGSSHVSSPPASYSPASVPMPPLHQPGPSHVPSAPVSYSPPQEPYPEQLPVHSDPPDSTRNSFAKFRNDRAPLVPIGDS